MCEVRANTQKGPLPDVLDLFSTHGSSFCYCWLATPLYRVFPRMQILPLRP